MKDKNKIENNKISGRQIPLKVVDSNLQNISEIYIKDTLNWELNEILKTNIEPLSEESSLLISPGSESNCKANLPLFKNYDYNLTEQVYLKDEIFTNIIVTQENEGVGSSDTDLHRAHLLQTLQGIEYVRSLSYSDYQSKTKPVYLPPCKLFKSAEATKTLIFDLDETLIHWVDDWEIGVAQYRIQIDFPNGDRVTAGINLRPFVKEWLAEANKYFQVIVFTASHKIYADAVLDFLDPKKELFQYRLYRDSCTQVDGGVYVKDLNIFKNRQLKNLTIIDNSVYSFGFQLDNGVPIVPFYDDPLDEELHHLKFYLRSLSQKWDMREQNIEAFQLSLIDSKFIEMYLREHRLQAKQSEADSDYKNIYSHEILVTGLDT